ncbi:MAG: LpqB family beta-propeller domain-containing protein [Actinomycetota bacterium]|nr:LpqB family beta-propeller domain-containing protein [Actinomycetota bacterium]
MTRRLALLLAAVLVLGGCVQVPTSGPVREGVQRGIGDEPPLQQVSAARPPPGAEPVEVVEGFFAAMLAYPADPAAVRSYLTDAAAAGWQPASGTTIYADRPALSGRRGGVVRVEAELAGNLTGRGAWSPPQRRRSVLDLDLTREHGQWRIANPPRGLHVTASYFARYYNPYSLYFFDPSARILVPDPVYLPEGEQTATMLMDGLSRGPTDWLAGAVRSFVPQGESPLPVRVSDAGVAEVTLGEAAATLGDEEVQLLAAQVAWTLAQVPEISAFRPSVDGVPLGVGGAGDTVGTDFGAAYDPADSAASSRLFAVRGQRLYEVRQDEAAAVPGPFGTGAVPVESFAVDRTGQSAAVVTGGGHDIRVGTLTGGQARGDVPMLALRGGRKLLRPQWDFTGLLWAADRLRGGLLVQVVREDESAPVDLSASTPTDVRAFALARDGVRVAVLDGVGQDARLLIGRVVRPAEGYAELRVDRWRVVQTPQLRLGGYRDVAWASPTELAVVARDGGGVPQLFTVSIDGSSALPTTLLEEPAVSVAASSTEALPTIVGTEGGTLWIQRGDRWEQLLDRRLTQPSYVE